MVYFGFHNPHQKSFRRHSIRLPDYDYSEDGSYFVTILTHGREPIFGEVIDGEVHLAPAGRIVWEVWKTLPERFSQVELDTAVVMPNHFHGIITINDNSKEDDSNVRAIGVDDSNIDDLVVRAIHPASGRFA